MYSPDVECVGPPTAKNDGGNRCTVDVKRVSASAKMHLHFVNGRVDLAEVVVRVVDGSRTTIVIPTISNGLCSELFMNALKVVGSHAQPRNADVGQFPPSPRKLDQRHATCPRRVNRGLCRRRLRRQQCHGCR